MNTDKIQINSECLDLEAIVSKLQFEQLQNWERNIYEFILNWFDQSDFILQLTSGSTGKPKEIKLKKSAMMASARKTIKYFTLNKNDSAWLCLPIEYIAGKMMVLRAIVGNLNLIISEPSGLPAPPKNSIQFAALVPLQLQNMINSAIDFNNIENIIVGGAVIDYRLQQNIQFLASNIYATYGMTETSSHIAIQRINGKNPDTDFQVLEGISISKNEKECLVINAPSLLNEEIVTNDLVELTSSKSFIWLGRADNVINSGGLKISPEILEKEISTIIKKECLIIAQQDNLLGQKIILILEGKNDKSLSEKLLIKIKKHIPKHRAPKTVHFIECFPRNKSMKIDRKAVSKLIHKT